MTTLVVSSLDLRAARPLRLAAEKRGWKVMDFDKARRRTLRGPIVVYSGTDWVDAICRNLSITLDEPAWDLLARLPYGLRLRHVEMTTAEALNHYSKRQFIKPADPRRRVFDAGVYESYERIPRRELFAENFPILVSEPVEFVAEYRLFIVGARIAASSPYMLSGRPIWKPFGSGGKPADVKQLLGGFVLRLNAACESLLPGAYVVDVGLIEGRGWAVVEFNPVWCSGILGAKPDDVLNALQAAVISTPRTTYPPEV